MTNALLSLFLDLVQIDSPSGDEDNIVAFVSDYLIKRGLQPVRDAYGNIIVKVSGHGDPLLLSAHLDTVQPGCGVEPVVTEGIVRSRGTTILGADNKVAVAVLLHILSDVTVRHRPLEVVFTRSEEVGNYGALHLDYSLLSAREGVMLDNPNPVGTIITASPFYTRFDITIRGKSAHASKPEQGIHVLRVLQEAMQHLTLGNVDKETVMNIGVIAGGTVRNAVMGEVTLSGEVRSFSEEKLEKVITHVQQVFGSSAQRLGADVLFVSERENNGYQYQETHTLIRIILATFNQQNIKAALVPDWGCSDANIFVAHGIETVNLGDGTRFTHTTKEEVSVLDIERLEQIVLSVITK